MKEVKYIPGDLVKASNNPNIVWIVKNVSQDKRGNVLYEVIAAEENDAFIYLYEYQIAPIPLTHAILEDNGWKKEPSENVTWYKYYTDKSYLYICKDSFTNKSWLVCVGLDKHYIANVKYVHQLQHFLFGLGLNSELKV